MFDFKKIPQKQIKYMDWALFALLMLIGLFARIYQFGQVPADINQDEAFAGYEAYNLLHGGMDSAGYDFPVYFMTWGSGMNALNSYLMIPFIAVFGLKTWVIRMPQLLVALFTLWVVYLLLSKTINKTAAFCGMFLLAIAPWHIFLSRWGLESNLAPGFLIFGLWFFVLGLEKSKYFMLSALFYGLSLYCYATIWPFVPLIIGCQLLYCFFYKKLKWNRYMAFSIIILGLLALPLLLFLLINTTGMKEIRLPFLSIPKLLYMRSSEISFKNIPANFKNLWGILTTQSDGLPWNSTKNFGLYYFCTLPFFGIGLIFYLKNFIKGIIKKEFSYDTFLLIQLLAGILLGLLITVNINRVNCLFIPLILITATGFYYLASLFNVKLLLIPLLVYSVLFVQFEQYYFTGYKQEINGYFCQGLQKAVETADNQTGTIYVTPNANYARVLFFSKEPVNEYRQTVKYTNYPSAFLDVSRFGRYCFQFDAANPDANATYILDGSYDTTPFVTAGFTIETFDYYMVAHK